MNIKIILYNAITGALQEQYAAIPLINVISMDRAQKINVNIIRSISCSMRYNIKIQDAYDNNINNEARYSLVAREDLFPYRMICSLD